MAADLREIIAYLDGLLEVDRFSDYGPNGLQVPGSGTVTRVVTGVSGQAELFERAVEAGAELVIVHHGILLDRAPVRIDPVRARRLKLLLCNDISLAAYHLPLDAHPEHGNNALLADALGCLERGREPFGEAAGQPVGFAASFPGGGVAIGELLRRVHQACGREPLAFTDGPEQVRRIGIVSGGASDMVADAAAAGLDAFLTGEPKEPAMALAREAGLHFIAAGHYATETFGVRRLGDLVARRFGVGHEFVDIPNPV